MPYREDDETPSTRRGREDDDIIPRQQAKLTEYLAERDQRAEARQRYERLREKREKELLDKITKLDDRVSDLYSLDRRDVDALTSFKIEFQEASREMKQFKNEMLADNRARDKAWAEFVGRVDGIKFAVMGAAGVAAAVGSLVAWLLSRIH